MANEFRKGARPLPVYSEDSSSEDLRPCAAPVRGALVIRNGHVVEISLEEYKEIGGVLQLNEHGVFGEILMDRSHAH